MYICLCERILMCVCVCVTECKTWTALHQSFMEAKMCVCVRVCERETECNTLTALLQSFMEAKRCVCVCVRVCVCVCVSERKTWTELLQSFKEAKMCLCMCVCACACACACACVWLSARHGRRCTRVAWWSKCVRVHVCVCVHVHVHLHVFWCVCVYTHTPDHSRYPTGSSRPSPASSRSATRSWRDISRPSTCCAPRNCSGTCCSRTTSQRKRISPKCPKRSLSSSPTSAWQSRKSQRSMYPRSKVSGVVIL